MAATDLLTDKAIKAELKQASMTGKPRRVADGGGLYLDARPTGAGWWRMRYWLDGREGMVSLGTYPDTSLKTARSRRSEARTLIASGVDPSERRKAEKAARVAVAVATRMAADGQPALGSFESVAREWHATVHSAKVCAKHANRTLVRFEQDVFPWLGARPIASIEAPELLAVLRKIEARGAIETTHRAKYACGQVFRYAVATGQCTRDPAADLRDALRPAPTRHLAAIVDPAGGRRLIKDLIGYVGRPVTRAALRLSAMLMLRPGELRQMEWKWIDLDSATLTIPPEIMKRSQAEKKNGPPHIVPLASQAISLLRELHPLTGHGRYVFPSLLTGERCLSENTVRAALRRLGYGNDDMTAHGFRAMARTMIAERLGFEPEVIEAQLAHAVPDALGRAYNRTQYLDQRRDMMTKWADYLDQLRDEEPGRTAAPARASASAA